MIKIIWLMRCDIMMKEKKIILFYLILSLCILVFCQMTSGDETNTELSIDDVTLSYGENNITALRIENVTELGSFQITIQWDTTVVDLQQVIQEDFSIVEYIDHIDGTGTITGFKDQGMTGSFILAQLEFKAIGSAGATCELQITYSELFNANLKPDRIEPQVIDGLASIQTSGMIVSAGGPYTTFIDEPITMSGSVSGGSDPYVFSWDLDNDGDYSDSSQQNPLWSWSKKGTYIIKLKVTDSLNLSVIVSTTVTVNEKDNGSSGDGNGQTPSDNERPFIIFIVTQTTQIIQANISFDASQSYDPNGDSLTFLWDFDDNTISLLPKTDHYYSQPGEYQVNLTVSDDKGNVNKTSILITILSTMNNPPSTPIIEGTSIGHMNTTYRFLFQSSDLDDDTLRYTIDWGDSQKEQTGLINESTEVSRTHQWKTAGKYTITVNATDNHTVSSTTTHTIYINARKIATIGYLFDDDGDGSYDTFYNEETGIQTIVNRLDTTSYAVDADDDGIWDYTYNMNSDVLTKSETNASGGQQNYIFIVVIIVIIILVLGGVIVFLRRQ